MEPQGDTMDTIVDAITKASPGRNRKHVLTVVTDVVDNPTWDTFVDHLPLDLRDRYTRFVEQERQKRKGTP